MEFTRIRPAAASAIAALVTAAGLMAPSALAESRDARDESAGRAAKRIEEWLGSRESRALAPGEARTRWLTRTGDRADDRLWLDALVRRAWGHERSGFDEGLRQYVTVRLIHDEFGGTPPNGAHFYSRRFFGGHVPFLVRQVPFSRPPDDPRPQPRWFPEIAGLPADSPDSLSRYAESPAARWVDAMFTVERSLGWPIVQLALAEFVAGSQTGANASDFVSALETVSRRDLRSFFATVADSQIVFDYAIDELVSEPAVSGQGFDTTVRIRRKGDGRFPMTVRVWFADGTEMREDWDGVAEVVSFRYASRVPALGAHVDHDRVLLLDRQRTNNVRTFQRVVHVPAIRWTLQWLIWLEDAMLSYGVLL